MTSAFSAAMALEHRIPPKPVLICHIGRLPPEVARLICRFLEEQDVFSLRLVCNFWDNVAASFMPRDLLLSFSSESFERLLHISQHPIISKQINSLHYEPNTLDELVSQDVWEKQIFGDGFLNNSNNIEPGPSTDANDQAKRHQKPGQKYSEYQLRKAYREYTLTYTDEKDLRNKGYGLDQLSTAIARLPNLSEICINHISARSRGNQRAKNVMVAIYSELVNDGK